MRRALAAASLTLALAACAPAEDHFADLPPREVPAGAEALADADGWEVTDGGVLAEAGSSFTLVVPDGAVPAAGEEPTEVVFHLDRVEPDGTLVETVDIVAVTVPPEGAPAETATLPDDAGVHYELFAEVTRADGTFTVYRDWLYAR